MWNPVRVQEVVNKKFHLLSRKDRTRRILRVNKKGQNRSRGGHDIVDGRGRTSF